MTIPTGLHLTECHRLLAYLKQEHQPGFFHQSEVERIARMFGKDSRTMKKYFSELMAAGLIGTDGETFYLRSWKYITGQLGWNIRGFRTNNLSKRRKFEAELFAAKVQSIAKAWGRVRIKGDAQIKFPIATALLARFCKCSAGKISNLKNRAESLGLLEVDRIFSEAIFEDGEFAGWSSVKVKGPILKVDDHLIASGKIVRRETDRLFSKVETFRIRNRKKRRVNGTIYKQKQ